MIKNLVFDFGRVLVDIDYMTLFEGYFGVDKESQARFCELFTKGEFIEACDRELISFAEIIANSQKEHPEFHDALQYFYDNIDALVVGEMPGMYELLEIYKDKGYKLYGLSNWGSPVYSVMARYKIFDLLDGRVISCEEKVIKPEREIFDRLCERYGLKAEECLFVDDKPENIEAARNAGMEGLVFTDTTSFARELEGVVATE